MSLLSRDFDKLMNNLAELDIPNVTQYNSYDISKTDSEYKYTFVATGVRKDDLSVEIVDNCIMLKAKPSVQTRFSKNINHLVYLHKDVDVENIVANISDGLLTLTMPRLQPTRKNVKITVS